MIIWEGIDLVTIGVFGVMMLVGVVWMLVDWLRGGPKS